MLEVTLADLFLFAWASVMTALYFYQKHQTHMARVVFMHFIENPEAREHMLKHYETQTKGEA